MEDGGVSAIYKWAAATMRGHNHVEAPYHHQTACCQASVPV
jgi:hypothetical protein